MRVCDRHKAEKSNWTVVIRKGHSEENYDLCDACAEEVREIINAPLDAPRKPGRPKKVAADPVHLTS